MDFLFTVNYTNNLCRLTTKTVVNSVKILKDAFNYVSAKLAVSYCTTNCENEIEGALLSRERVIVNLVNALLKAM